MLQSWRRRPTRLPACRLEWETLTTVLLCFKFQNGNLSVPNAQICSLSTNSLATSEVALEHVQGEVALEHVQGSS